MSYLPYPLNAPGWDRNGRDRTNERSRSAGGSTPAVTWEAWGHSFISGTGASGPDKIAVRRFADQAGVGVTNRGRSGAIVGNNSNVSGGGDTGNWTQIYRALPNGNPNKLNIIMMWGINDLIGGTAAARRAQWQSAMRGMICLALQKARYEDNDASFAYVTYANTADAADATARCSGSSYRLATTGTPTATVTVPSGYAGGGLQFGYLGLVNGAEHTLTLDGGAAGTQTTHAQCSNVFNTVVVPKRVTATAGAHTLVSTLNSYAASGQSRVDWWAEEWGASDSPPKVLVNNIPRPVSYPGAWSSLDDTMVATFNADLATVVAEFGAHVVLIDADTALDKNAANFDTDSFHPNDAGHEILADLWLAEV